VAFVADKVVLGQVLSEYFGFSCQSLFRQFFHDHHHLSPGAGTIDQLWPQYQKSHPLIIKTNKKVSFSVFSMQNSNRHFP
jgi:hypothetical protein